MKKSLVAGAGGLVRGRRTRIHATFVRAPFTRTGPERTYAWFQDPIKEQRA